MGEGNGLCECGCGEPTKPIHMTSTARGLVKGEPRRFVRGHQARLMRVGSVVRDGVESLKCGRCKEWKSVEAFGRSGVRSSGRQGWCRGCVAVSHRESALKRYGLTVSEFEALWAEQGGHCAACNAAMTRRTHRPDSVHVDHDHSTGAVRGLTCGMCNIGIGCFYDDPERLRRAAAYLEVRH